MFEDIDSILYFYVFAFLHCLCLFLAGEDKWRIVHAVIAISLSPPHPQTPTIHQPTATPPHPISHQRQTGAFQPTTDNQILISVSVGIVIVIVICYCYCHQHQIFQKSSLKRNLSSTSRNMFPSPRKSLSAVTDFASLLIN